MECVHRRTVHPNRNAENGNWYIAMSRALVQGFTMGAAALAVAALSACQPTSTASGSTTPTPAATPSATTSSTAEAARASACQGSQISLKTAPGGQGMGHDGLILRFTNAGSNTCTLTGYPGAAVTDGGQDPGVDPQGNAARQSTTAGAAPVRTVTLAPGATASAQLFWTTAPMNNDADRNAANCLSYRGGALEVTPPNTTATKKLDPPEDMCQHLQVSPVVSGDSGTA